MNWNDILMSTLIATIVSSAVAIIGIVLADVLSSRRVESNISQLEKNLSGTKETLHEDGTQVKSQLQGQSFELEKHLSEEHAQRRHEHSNLAHDHNKIIERLDSIWKAATDTYTSFARHDEAQKHNYENLSDTQKEIHHSIENLEQLRVDWERVITENREISARESELNIRIDGLVQQLADREWQIRAQQEQIEQLKATISELIQETRNPPGPTQPTHNFPPIQL